MKDNMYTIKVAHERGERRFWVPVGTLFHNPASDDYKESLTIQFDSLPPVGRDCKAFPVNEEARSAEASGRFNLVVPLERQAGKTYYHKLGTAFHNAPSGEHKESFSILLETLPLDGDVKGYPAEAEVPDQASHDAEAPIEGGSPSGMRAASKRAARKDQRQR